VRTLNTYDRRKRRPSPTLYLAIPQPCPSKIAASAQPQAQRIPATMDPLSISASIAGLVTVTDMIAGKSYKYIKEARSASKEVKKLLEEITDLFGILNSLRLVASQYEDEAFNSTMQSQHIHSCHMLLGKIRVDWIRRIRVKRMKRSRQSDRKRLLWRGHSSGPSRLPKLSR
jgi:hypothetical protein